GDALLDVALDDAFAEVDRAARVPGGPLALFAHVDQQHRRIARLAAGVGDGDLAHARPRVLAQALETGGVLLRRHVLELHPDGLDLRVEVDRVAAELASVAALLVAAERRRGAEHVVAVDPQGPGADGARH